MVMLKALHNGALGMNAQQMRIDVMANNLANINSPGFKKHRGLFSELVNQSVAYLGAPARPEVTSGNGVRVAQVAKYFSEGDLDHTERELDLAIVGEGFFRVVRNGEVFFTRDGVFNLDERGNMVNSNGCVLEGVRIEPGTTRITVGTDGAVTATGTEGIYEAGQILLYRFNHLAMLKHEGENLFSFNPTDGEIVPDVPGSSGYGTIVQGFLERANFTLVEEMSNLIEAHRAYGFNARTTRTVDELWGIANNLRK